MGKTKFATTKTILTAKKFFDENPDGIVKTGFWTDPVWNKDQFYRWFRKCLNIKCGGGEYTEKEYNRILDARIINDYVGKRIRMSGSRNILRTPFLQKKYPHINTQKFEI